MQAIAATTKQVTTPLLGDVEVHVITLFHGRSIVEWQIADRVNLGIAFDWNIAVFTSASYVDPSAYISATDSEPPELGTGNEMTNIYSVGRASLSICSERVATGRRWQRWRLVGNVWHGPSNHKLRPLP